MTDRFAIINLDTTGGINVESQHAILALGNQFEMHKFIAQAIHRGFEHFAQLVSYGRHLNSVNNFRSQLYQPQKKGPRPINISGFPEMQNPASAGSHITFR